MTVPPEGARTVLYVCTALLNVHTRIIIIVTTTTAAAAAMPSMPWQDGWRLNA